MATTSCDVLIVGGGPAGSSCAQRLVEAGADVALIDRAVFPRDKVCAGWITPAVVRALALDLADYSRGRTLQPFTGFKTGLLSGRLRLTDFGEPVSYGIRRCEFDEYLLTRSGVPRLDPAPLRTLRRDGDAWIVDDTIRARMIVGAGGHFCPVARVLNRDTGSGMDQRGGVVPEARPAFKGHAYLLNMTSRRRLYGSGVLLAGDAAGLALAPSGEGILAAVESGILAADTIVATGPDYSCGRLAVYERRIYERFGARSIGVRSMPGWLSALASNMVLGIPWLTRRMVLENGFLHTRRPELVRHAA